MTKTDQKDVTKNTKKKNRVILAGILGFVLVVYAITVIKLKMFVAAAG